MDVQKATLAFSNLLLTSDLDTQTGPRHVQDVPPYPQIPNRHTDGQKVRKLPVPHKPDVNK